MEIDVLLDYIIHLVLKFCDFFSWDFLVGVLFSEEQGSITLNYYYLLQNTAQQLYAFKKLSSKSTPPSPLKPILRITILNSTLIDFVIVLWRVADIANACIFVFSVISLWEMLLLMIIDDPSQCVQYIFPQMKNPRNWSWTIK